MGDNLQWLFGAFGIGWLIHMAYLLSISRREKQAMQEIAELQRSLRKD